MSVGSNQILAVIFSFASEVVQDRTKSSNIVAWAVSFVPIDRTLLENEVIRLASYIDCLLCCVGCRTSDGYACLVHGKPRSCQPDDNARGMHSRTQWLRQKLPFCSGLELWVSRISWIEDFLHFPFDCSNICGEFNGISVAND